MNKLINNALYVASNFTNYSALKYFWGEDFHTLYYLNFPTLFYFEAEDVTIDQIIWNKSLKTQSCWTARSTDFIWMTFPDTVSISYVVWRHP